MKATAVPRSRKKKSAQVRQEPARVAWTSRRWAPWAVFLGATAVVLLFLAALPARYATNEATDFQYFYEPVAIRLLSGEGFLTPSGVAARYPPGYPIVVASIYWLADLTDIARPSLLWFATAAFTGAGAGLLFAFGRAAFGPWAGLISSALWISYPAALWMSKQPGSEGPFSALLVAAFWLVWNIIRKTRLHWLAPFVAGGAIGVLMLIRPIAIGLPFLAAAGILLLAADPDRARRWTAAAAVIAGSFVAILPWEAFVHRHTGTWIPLSTGGAVTMRDGLTFAVRAKGFRQGTSVPADVRNLMQDLSNRYDELDSPGKIAGVLAHEFAQRPVAVAKLMAIKAARSWYGTDSQRLETPLLLIHAFYLAGLLAALWLGFRRGGVYCTLAWALAGVMLYFWAMTAIALPLVRYMTPMMTMSFLLMGAVFTASKPCSRAKVGVLY